MDSIFILIYNSQSEKSGFTRAGSVVSSQLESWETTTAPPSGSHGTQVLTAAIVVLAGVPLCDVSERDTGYQ